MIRAIVQAGTHYMEELGGSNSAWDSLWRSHRSVHWADSWEISRFLSGRRNMESHSKEGKWHKQYLDMWKLILYLLKFLTEAYGWKWGIVKEDVEDRMGW